MDALGETVLEAATVDLDAVADVTCEDDPEALGDTDANLRFLSIIRFITPL